MSKSTDTLSAILSRRAALTGLGALAVLPGGALAQSGLILLMVDDENCRYCRKFDAEIGGGYSRSPQGRIAPLQKVRRQSRELQPFNPVIYTPTFLLVRRGEELGRITGYPGFEYFYPELDLLLAKEGYAPGPVVAPQGTRT